MSKKNIFFAGALLYCSTIAMGQYVMQKLWKTTQLGPTAVLVTCLNGADPTGNKLQSTKDNNTLIVSCAIQHPAK